MTDVPWPDGPQPCHVELNAEGHGWLTFIDPAIGINHSLPISTGDADYRELRGPDGETRRLAHWRWHDHGDGTGHTTPSILVHGHKASPGFDTPETPGWRPGYHSPFRTEWIKTPANPDGTWPAD